MTKPKRRNPKGPPLREFWIVESEYGMDIKRHIRSIHPSKEEAEAFQAYLIIKSPYDKHEVFRVREVRK